MLADPTRRAAYDTEAGVTLARPSWEVAVATFARAMASAAGDRLEGIRREGGDLASHAIGRAVTHGAVAVAEVAVAEGVANAVVRSELQASLQVGERLTANAVSKGVGARMIPLLGAVVSGALDAATTARAGAAARRAFSPLQGPRSPE